MNERIVNAPAFLAAFERLAVALAKVPAERIPQVDRDASNFVTGLEAGVRVSQENRPTV